MPTFMHQWSYKDQQIREMLGSNEDMHRADLVRTAVEAFGGTMHGFYYAFGECDGVAISEFPDESSALACVMMIFGQGRLQSVRTTLLFPPNASIKAIQMAQGIIKGGVPAGQP